MRERVVLVSLNRALRYIASPRPSCGVTALEEDGICACGVAVIADVIRRNLHSLLERCRRLSELLGSAVCQTERLPIFGPSRLRSSCVQCQVYGQMACYMKA